MRNQMYFTETRCDKVSEGTIAFQMSTIKPEVVPRTCDYDRRWAKIHIPMRRNPRGMTLVNCSHTVNFIPQGRFISNMCDALLPKDQRHNIIELSGKLRKVLTTPKVISDLRLVSVMILDGRLCFTLWEPSGFLEVKVLPMELRGTDNFELEIHDGLHTRDTTQITCILTGGEQYRFVVTRYHCGRRRGTRCEVMMTREINYRLLSKSNNDETPHFTGFMETLTVR